MILSKKSVTMSIVFYVLMSIIFTGILIYGTSKIFFIEEQIDIQENFELKEDLKKIFTFCEDPLNKGNIKTFEFKTDLNLIVKTNKKELEKSDFEKHNILIENLDEINLILETEKNNILIRANIKKGNDFYNIVNYQILGSFKTTNYKTDIIFDFENSGYKDFRVEC